MLEGRCIATPLSLYFSNMFACIQFPMTDLRGLLKEPTFKLPTPFWPSPNTNQMVRYFGLTRIRPKGGIEIWADEEYVCNAKRALRFTKGVTIDGPGSIRTKVPFRRFNGDGKLLCKYEIGFSDNLESIIEASDEASAKSRLYLESVLREYAHLSVKVPQISSETIQLNKAGPRLAQLYFKASTDMKEWENPEINRFWLQSGEPVMVGIYDDNHIEPPKKAKLIPIKALEQGGIKLHYYLIALKNGGHLRAWLIGKKSGVDKEMLRGLRMNLFRINAEIETVRQVLNAIRTKRINIESDTLLKQSVGKSLEKLTSNLFKKERYSIEQTEILELAIRSIEQVSPGKAKQLDYEYKDLIEEIKPLKNDYVALNLEKLKSHGVEPIILITIKIFLASSSELKNDRKDFEVFISRKNKEYIKKGVFLEVVLWEDFLDAMSRTGLQDEYNKAIEDCDVFLSLFHTKVGKYTEEEFAKAYETFRANGKPLVYTYLKDAAIPPSESLNNFKKKLRALEHYFTRYANIDDLKYQFNGQIEKFLPGLIEA